MNDEGYEAHSLTGVGIREITERFCDYFLRLLFGSFRKCYNICTI